MSNPETTQEQPTSETIDQALAQTPLGESAIAARGITTQDEADPRLREDSVVGPITFPGRGKTVMTQAVRFRNWLNTALSSEGEMEQVAAQNAERENRKAKAEATYAILREAGHINAATSIPYIGFFDLMPMPINGKLPNEWEECVKEFGEKHTTSKETGFYVVLPGGVGVALSSEKGGSTILECPNTVITTQDFKEVPGENGETIEVPIEGILEQVFRGLADRYPYATTASLLDVMRHYFPNHKDWDATFGAHNAKPDSTLKKFEDAMVEAAATLMLAVEDTTSTLTVGSKKQLTPTENLRERERRAHASMEVAKSDRSPSAIRMAVAAVVLAVLTAAAVKTPLDVIKVQAANKAHAAKVIDVEK